MSILKNAFVVYDENFIEIDKANQYFELFNSTFDFKYNDYNGYALNRQTCAFADSELIKQSKKIPSIWGDNLVVKEWTPELLEIKNKIEGKVKEMTGKEWSYSIALCNRYTKKSDYIAFHKDREEFSSTKSIASISLGIPRTFTFESDDKTEKLSIPLQNGSLIYMGDNCQENYRHGMKKEDLSLLCDDETLQKYNNTRINITFRVFDY